MDAAWIEEINLARTNPKQYATFVKAIEHEYIKDNVWKLPGRTALRTKEGWNGPKELIAFLESASPLPAFKVHPTMSRCAAELTKDMGDNGHTNHDLADGTDFQTRLDKYGEPEEALTELTSFHFATPRQGVIALLTDDGDPTRNNRTSIFGAVWTFRRGGSRIVFAFRSSVQG